MPVFPLTDWSVSALRMTAFPTIAERRQDVSWWTDVMEREPETRTVKATPAQIEVSGAFEAGVSRLNLSVTAVRTDWLLVGEPTPSPWPDMVGSFPDAFPAFLARMRRWLMLDENRRFAVQRLALGALLHHQEQSRIDGYNRIGRYLSRTLHLNPQTSSDLSFQINWFRPSEAVPGTKVNRVSKWAVLALRLITVPVGSLTATEGLDEVHSTTLELDISTPADRREPLPNASLIDILTELSHQVEQIAAEGDGA